MVKYTLVMDLAKKLSSRLTKDKLISTAIMGEGKYILGQYDPTKTYHLGDKIPYLTDKGELVILIALEDNITGPMDLRQWEEWDIISETIRIYQEMIQLSWQVPKQRLNRVWLSIKKESMADFTQLDMNIDGILVYSNFIISKNRPTMTKNVIWGKVTELVDGAGTVDPGGWDEEYVIPTPPDNNNTGSGESGNESGGESGSDGNGQTPPSPGSSIKLAKDYYRMIDVYPQTYSTITSVDVELDTSDLTDTSYMFALSGKLQSIPTLNLSKVETANSMFKGCSRLPAVNADFSNIVEASNMFEDCSNLGPMNDLDFSSLTTAERMFYGDINVRIENSIFPSVRYAERMFLTCKNATFKNTVFGSPEDATEMFHGCRSMEELPNIDLSRTLKMSKIFYDCLKLRGEFKQTFIIEPSTLKNRYQHRYSFDRSALDSIDIKYIFENSLTSSSDLQITNMFGFDIFEDMGKLKRLRLNYDNIFTYGGLTLTNLPNLKIVEIGVPSIDKIKQYMPDYSNRLLDSSNNYKRLLFDEYNNISSNRLTIDNCVKLNYFIYRCDTKHLTDELRVYITNKLNEIMPNNTLGAWKGVYFLDYDAPTPEGVPRFEDIQID